MQQHTIQVGPILQKSRSIFKKHFWTICKLLLITIAPILLVVIIEILVAAIFPAYVVKTIPNNNIQFLQPLDSIFIILNIIASLVSAYFVLGLLKAQIRLVHDEKPTEKTLFSTTRMQFLNYILAMIVVIIVVWLLLFLIIAPARMLLYGTATTNSITIIKTIFSIVWGLFVLIAGIYFAIRLQFFKFYITKGENTLQAFKKSRTITDGHEWKLFFLIISYLAIIIAIFAIRAGVFLGISALLQSMRGLGTIGIIISIILLVCIALCYFIALVLAYTTKELSLTQAFLKLHDEK